MVNLSNRLLQPQEIEVFYLLPAIRRELTLGMKTLGKQQKEIARLLGVTEPAISQYLSAKRANGVRFPKELKAEIRQAAGKISDQQSLYAQTQRLLGLCRKARLICQVHGLLGLGFSPKNCTACFNR